MLVRRLATAVCIVLASVVVGAVDADETAGTAVGRVGAVGGAVGAVAVDSG